MLWKYFDSKEFVFSQESFQSVSCSDALARHIDKIIGISYFNEELMKKLAERKFRVVVDAVNASGSVIVPMLLKKLGCEVIPLYCDGSGIFPHTPEPLAANLTALSEAVKSNNADMGIAVDPDADRLVLIDNNGAPVNEEKTIVLASLPVIKKADKGAVFTVNHSTSMMLEYMAQDYGIAVNRAPVGEINVVKKMKETGAVFGGEGSGGVILPECHYGRDSLVGIALVLIALADSDKTLSRLSSGLPDLKMVKHKQDFSGDFSLLKSNLVNLFDNARMVDDDGLKFIFDDMWVQIRSSNTEPVIRVIAEAHSEADAQSLIKRITLNI